MERIDDAREIDSAMATSEAMRAFEALLQLPSAPAAAAAPPPSPMLPSAPAAAAAAVPPSPISLRQFNSDTEASSEPARAPVLQNWGSASPLSGSSDADVVVTPPVTKNWKTLSHMLATRRALKEAQTLFVPHAPNFPPPAPKLMPTMKSHPPPQPSSVDISVVASSSDLPLLRPSSVPAPWQRRQIERARQGLPDPQADPQQSSQQWDEDQHEPQEHQEQWESWQQQQQWDSESWQQQHEPQEQLYSESQQDGSWQHWKSMSWQAREENLDQERADELFVQQFPRYWDSVPHSDEEQQETQTNDSSSMSRSLYERRHYNDDVWLVLLTDSATEHGLRPSLVKYSSRMSSSRSGWSTIARSTSFNWTEMI
jgi:hypothetical protein